MAKTRRILILLQLALIVSLVGVWTDLPLWERAKADTYTIAEGDTLWAIADRLQIRFSVLLALNPELDPADNIYAGQQIQIPDNTASQQTNEQPASTSQTTSEAPLESSGETTLYIVQPGDMLSVIAETLGTDIDTLLRLNPGLNPNLLYAGATIVVPVVDQSRRSLNAGVQAPEPFWPPQQTTEYVVQPGDSPLGIAERAGISLEELIRANPLTDFNAVIHPGDVLNIPVPDHLAPALDPADAAGALTTHYTVRGGDSASAIAQRYGISLEQLRQLNGGSELNLIQTGQTLIVPWTGESLHDAAGTVPAVEVRRRSYRVQAGDTFSGIAHSHGLSLDELRELNPSLPRDLVFVGQLIYLPGTIEPPVVAHEPTLQESDLVQYAAAALGVTPHTLLANHSWLSADQWLDAGTSWRLPLREGLLVTVEPGDTLRAIADRHGVAMDAILADPAHGVDDPNAIVIGQEIIIPLSMPDFIWPAHGELTDPFGLCRSWDCSYRHKGLDIALDLSAPIVAAADGVVTFVGGDPLFGLGWYVEIDHGDGWLTVYAHLVEFGVFQGQTINQGEVIGYNGNTGYSTGPHLHFEVQHDDWYIDPLAVLP